MALKPRIVLAALVVASLLGVSLTWAGTGTPIVVPIAAWIAIVSLGTLLTNGLLWLRYARGTERLPGWLARRWSRIGHVAGGAAVAGTTVRLASTVDVVALPASVGAGALIGTVVIAVAITAGRWSIPARVTRSLVLAGSVFAGLGLVTVAWVDVGSQGSVGAVVVRAIHLVAVGAWIGGAVWHNTVVVPALGIDGETAVEPTVRRFQRVVPVLIGGVVLTGVYQATTWLGADVSPYLTTTVGRIVGVKLLLVGLLAALVVHGRVRSRRSRSRTGDRPQTR